MKILRLVPILILALLTAPLSADCDRQQVFEQATDVQPLLPGMQAPAFTVKDASGKDFRFDPENLQQPVVITFFRGGWCPYCNLHLSEMRKAEAELKAMGFDIYFISVDKPEVLYASLEQPSVSYTLFSDAGLEATRAFGIAFRVPQELVDKYMGWGIDLEAASGETHHVLPAPATFLVGAGGLIRFQYTNPDYAVRLHPDVLLAAAKSYQDDADQRLKREMEARRAK